MSDEQTKPPVGHVRTGSWREARAEILVGLMAIACFANIVPNDFCYDDIAIIRNNAKITAPAQWSAIWTTDYWSQTASESPHRDLLYRPISLSTFHLIWTVARNRPFAFHLFSIMLHGLVSVLVVRLCRHGGLNARSSLAGGMIFAVWPIHTEVVASAVGLADLLAATGILLAIFFHDRAMSAQSSVFALPFKCATAVSVFLAMGAKESGVASIPIVVLWDGHRHRTHRPGETGSRRWCLRSAARLSYLLVPLSAYAALRLHALGGQWFQSPAPTKTVNVLVDAPLWQHALGTFQLWGMYWAKSLFPKTLCIEYAINAIRLPTSLIDFDVSLGVVATAALLIVAVIAWRRRLRFATLAAMALLICYLPASNSCVLIQVFFAERLWYLPSIFAAALLGLATANLLKYPAGRVAGIVVLAVMLGRCWIRNAEWRDNGTLYAATYRDHPDSVLALHLYGQWLARNGEFVRGVELVRRALDIDPGFTDAHRTLGVAFLEHGQPEDALYHLRIADMQVPENPPTHAALERASDEVLRKGQGDEIDRLRREADARREEIGPQLALIRRLRDLGRTEQALIRLQSGEDRFADYVEWQAEYAVTLVYLDQRDLAIAHYRSAIRLSPRSPQLMVELAMLLLERRDEGDVGDAKRLSEQAEILAPDNPAVLVCRAEVLALAGEISEAIELYHRAAAGLALDDPRHRMFEERAKALGR